MPGTYAVKDRGAAWGRAGLALPYTPTKGPLTIAYKNDLRYLEMSQPFWGDPSQDQYAGCFTEGVSDCSVVAVMEWHPTKGRWAKYYFQHVAGSDITKETMAIAGSVFHKKIGPRYAVVAQYYGGIAFSLADEFFEELGIPKQNRSYYQSGFSGMNFGLRFFGGCFGEYLT